jgi:hypothetical protein
MIAAAVVIAVVVAAKLINSYEFFSSARACLGATFFLIEWLFFLFEGAKSNRSKSCGKTSFL